MPVSSSRPDLTIPDVGLYDFVYGTLDYNDEDRIAVIDIADGSQTTYAEVRTFVNSVAGGLAQRGVRTGDVVALHCPNSEAFIIYAHALWRLGAVVSPLPLLATPETIASQLVDSGAKLLLTCAALGDSGNEGAAAAGLGADQVIHLDTSRGIRQMIAERIAPPPVEFDPRTHIAALPYSSGTTGLPKGVQLTHRNLVANIAQSADYQLLRRDDVVFGVLPFFHIYGLTTLVNLSIYQRATVITQPRFSIDSFLAAHEKYGVTFTFIAPPIAVLLAKHPAVDSYDLSKLRGLLSGAASLDEGLADAVERRLKVPVQQGFGLTETSPVTHVNLDENVSRGSIGLPVANTEHKLVEVDTGREIPVPQGGGEGSESGRSEVGELWVRGPQIMAGYLNNEEETRIALPGDGWLRTGDLAVHDASGRVYIVDRLKEVIKYKGYQVPPAELEALLLTHPGVADAGVIGVTRDGKEVPKAFVVRQGGGGEQPSEQDIMDFVAERVSAYKKIREVEFVDTIPKSATGKILRRELKAMEKS
ncbi:AMP-binding protein [Corynebacterium heidelbergense]|uniref:4-coumarate--CoA ligase family protein n=1 Tax=Corynebacterium heidelbergense TaxID=2055947 RepID=A0A364VAM7_9CORY|nr:AMP-binding protein [Corynebacterium heidelbergense]RAV33671.1 4-coumarate--CoA ligase family protein [Corynebacterium heidelbergense]WCZ36128.1 Long-chain-fatty-acid--CoA ligase [Corynebacterium heidelbergense]